MSLQKAISTPRRSTSSSRERIRTRLSATTWSASGRFPPAWSSASPPYAAVGRWLDVGFGNGSLLFTAEEWGFTPVGLDLRKDNVAMLKSLGYEAHCAPIESLDGDGRYDVVSMADVLEHMPFPKTGLNAARRLLRPGGALFLSMPNMDSMVWRLLHANKINPYWGEIEHYHNFTRRRLCDLLDEQGFEAVAYHVSERYRVCMEVVALRR